MEVSNQSCVKLVIASLLLILMLYYLSLQTNHDGIRLTYDLIHTTLNKNQTFDIFVRVPNATITNRNTTTITTSTTNPPTTSTTNLPTTIDPAELVVERLPLPSRINSDVVKGTMAVFLFQTQHHVLTNLQLYLIRRLTINLVAVEVFTDGPATKDMQNVADLHNALLHSFPSELHLPRASGSDRNTDVVNWAIAKRSRLYLGNGTAILLLDGDVFPLTPYDAKTLLNSRDLICRKHPALLSRYCWIGFICISPHLYSTIHDFNVSQVIRSGRAYDSGGRTIEYLLKYPDTSFSWMRETIFLNPDKELFWGAFDGDIQWISRNFGRCDKCGPEIFFSPFNNSNAVFYHMISATSEWRFGHQGPRRQSLYDAVMKSPYGPGQQYALSDLTASIKKVQKMDTIPFSGKLSCSSVCRG
jgi:hypothetical protein